MGMLVVLALLVGMVAGSAFADDSFTLSKFADFSASHRFFSVDDTLYMRVITDDLDAAGIESSEFSLTPRGNGTPVSGTFQNHLDGTFTAAFPLAELQGETRSWIWRASLVDDDGREFHAEADILVNGMNGAQEVFVLRGMLESVSSDEVVISGRSVAVDSNTQVIGAQGGRINVTELQTGEMVTATVKEDADGNLLAVVIIVQGSDEGELEISGLIEQVTDTSLVVNGVTLLIDSGTVIRGRHGMTMSPSDLSPGMRVKVRARQQADGSWLATEIRIHDPEDGRDGAESKMVGTVQEVGANYLVVAGQRFEVDASTSFDGFSSLSELAIGDRVKIEFEMMPNGFFRAREIEREEEDDDDDGGEGVEVEVRGTITALSDSSLEVGGVLFLITDATQILGEEDENLSPGALYSGLLVEVKGARQTDGSVLALRVKVEDDLKTEMEVKGFVEARTDTSFQLAGLWIQVTAETTIEGDEHAQLSFADIQVGVFVEVKLQVGLDSTLVAVRIEIEDRFGDDEVEITGTIDSLAADAIVVAGQLFSVDANTRVLDRDKTPIDFSSLSLGQMVKVKARRMMDGSLVAREIRLKNRIHAEGEVKGPIVAIQGDTLEVAGILIRVGPQTIFRGAASASDLVVGQWVEVHYRLLPDSSRLALRIKVENSPGNEVEFSGSIEVISDNGLTVASVSLTVTASTQIRAADGSAITLQDLSVGQTVEVHATLSAGGLEAVEIQVKETTVIAAAIDALNNGSISLAGHDVIIDAQTLIVGRNNADLSEDDLQPGTYVEVVAVSATSGGLGKSAGAASVAERIEVKQAATVTGLGSSETTASLPTGFTLQQNYPNPFNPSTTIRFVLGKQSEVTLKVYNLLGQEVRTLLSAPLGAGTYQVLWDGRDDFGRTVASGVYLYRMEAAGQVQTKRMVLTK
jgi:hypothetical protein